MELPDAKAIFPYLGLFTLVTLNPTRVIGDSIPTLFVPPLSIIRGKKFVNASSKTSPSSKNVARIFDPLALFDNSPFNPGAIPISPNDQASKGMCYWRIPVPPAYIFAALIEQLKYDSSECKDIRLAKTIHYTLGLQSLNEYSLDENDGNGGPSGSGGGPKGGDTRTSSKRKNLGSKSNASPRKGKEKARKTSGGSISRACDKSGGEAPFSFWFASSKTLCAT